MKSKYREKFERDWEGEDISRIRKWTRDINVKKKIKMEQEQADKNITNILKKKLVVHRRRYKK